MNRRDFSKMVVAAVGGIVAGGAMLGCSGDGDKGSGGSKDHMCAGKNECKGLGGCHTATNSCGGKNECKGKGGCASASMKHDCKGKNNCKGMGNCSTGDAGCAGKNTCKGKGGCAVPKKH
ncbi:MAG: hypothetical protein K8T20_16870 [Planctomycetes bacterium]|nr:hypothetical protein [Planctomycetota bacterium]